MEGYPTSSIGSRIKCRIIGGGSPSRALSPRSVLDVDDVASSEESSSSLFYGYHHQHHEQQHHQHYHHVLVGGKRKFPFEEAEAEAEVPMVDKWINVYVLCLSTTRINKNYGGIASY